MNFLKNPEIDNHPLVQCIQQTDILCDTNKKLLYQELKISPLYTLKNIIVRHTSFPSQEHEIRELFERVLPYNDNAVNKLMEQYTTIKDRIEL